jgi:hypothetical protein
MILAIWIVVWRRNRRPHFHQVLFMAYDVPSILTAQMHTVVLCPTVRGLKGESKVAGTGVVEWTIFDVDGLTQMICTKAFYIPEGNI